jgi:bis(5'-nucleosyl)-tetraphosphatase (symmetrical)
LALYLVGDVQGCFSELTALLAQVNFNTTDDELYLAGDLVARGPDSLATLRFVKSLGNSAKIVLGNHDLHLLSVYAGIKKEKKSDKLAELLAAHDIDELMTWLAQQPLLQIIPAIENNNSEKSTITAYMSHAGITPQWSLTEAIEQARAIEKKLQSPERNKWLARMYGESPNHWHNAHTDIEKFRFSINAFTRMRYCFADGSLEFTQKEAPLKNNTKTSDSSHSKNKAKQEGSLLPWYELSNEINKHPWVFGHWASLMGQCAHTNIYPLDTGCVWGNHLTMLRWHDKKILIEQAHPKTLA